MLSVIMVVVHHQVILIMCADIVAVVTLIHSMIRFLVRQQNQTGFGLILTLTLEEQFELGDDQFSFCFPFIKSSMRVSTSRPTFQQVICEVYDVSSSFCVPPTNQTSCTSEALRPFLSPVSLTCTQV